MLNISQDQAIRRYDTLPKTLKDAIFSDYTNVVILKSAHDNHLNNYQTDDLGIIVGDILMGFIHPNDLEKQLKENLELEPLVVSDIAKEINQKILTPLTSDIEKNYNPEISEVEPIRAEEAGQEAPQSMEVAPTPILGKENISETAVSPQPLKIESETPIAEKKISPLAEKFAAKATAPVATLTPESANKAEPAPMPLEPTIIHEEQATPLQKSINLGDFQIELPQSKKPVASAIAAEFEMGNYRAPAVSATAKQPVVSTAPKTEIPRVVHYSAYSTPLSSPIKPKSESSLGEQTTSATSSEQAASLKPETNLGEQANKNAFTQLGKNKPEETISLPLKSPEKNLGANAQSETAARTGEKPASKFINLNDFGIVNETAKSATTPKGPEIKGNTVDLTK
jgi:hypothetical protein